MEVFPGSTFDVRRAELFMHDRREETFVVSVSKIFATKNELSVGWCCMQSNQLIKTASCFEC